MKKTPREITPKEALLRLADMCARAEHCSGEIAEKLRRWRIPPQESQEIIARLTRERYVDDSRFARAFVRDKVVMARWGRRKVAQALYLKHVDRGIVGEALAEIDTEAYRDNLEHILMAKIKQTPTLAQSYEGRTKLYRFALGRGYEPQLAAEVLRQLIAKIS